MILASCTMMCIVCVCRFSCVKCFLLFIVPAAPVGMPPPMQVMQSVSMPQQVIALGSAPPRVTASYYSTAPQCAVPMMVSAPMVCYLVHCVTLQQLNLRQRMCKSDIWSGLSLKKCRVGHVKCTRFVQKCYWACEMVLRVEVGTIAAFVLETCWVQDLWFDIYRLLHGKIDIAPII